MLINFVSRVSESEEKQHDAKLHSNHLNLRKYESLFFTRICTERILLQKTFSRQHSQDT